MIEYSALSQPNIKPATHNMTALKPSITLKVSILLFSER